MRTPPYMTDLSRSLPPNLGVKLGTWPELAPRTGRIAARSVTRRPRRPISISRETFLDHPHHAPYHYHRWPIVSLQKEDTGEVSRQVSTAGADRLIHGSLSVQTMDATTRHLGPCQMRTSQQRGDRINPQRAHDGAPYLFHRSPMIFCR